MSALGYFFRRIVSAPKSIVGSIRANKHFKKTYIPKKLSNEERRANLVVQISEEASRRHWINTFKAGHNIQDIPAMNLNYSLIRQTFLKYPLVKGAKIASYGCGIGSQELILASEKPTIKVSAVDFAPDMLKKGEALRESEFRQVGDRVSFSEGSFAKPNLQKKDYDCVMSIDAFHWAEDRYQALKNLKDLINPKSKNKLLLLTYREGGTFRMDNEVMANGITRREFVKQNFSSTQVIHDLVELGFVVDSPKVSSVKHSTITKIVARLK